MTIKIAQLSCGTEYSSVQYEIEKAARSVGATIVYPDVSSADIDKAVAELRRVCGGRLIVVLPKQREYKYTFDLHIHFFPYRYNVERLLGTSGTIEKLGGDWYYIEDIQT